MTLSMKIVSSAFALTIALLLTFASPTGIAATPTVASPPPAPALAPMTIMELGDSITAGVGPNGVDNGRAGYRLPLTRLLEAGGYDFKMVGSRADYSGTLDVGDHEGWPGYVLRSFPSDPAPQLLGAVTASAITKYHPSVILLMAGTNDLLRHARNSKDYTQANIARSLDMELAQIFGLEPSARVIVAGVVDSPRVPHAAVAAFSNDVTTLVERYRSRGFRIAQAEGMSSAVPRNGGSFPDGIHPATLGYDSMAAVWFKALGTTLALWPNPSVKVAGGPTVARTTDGQPQH